MYEPFTFTSTCTPSPLSFEPFRLPPAVRQALEYKPQQRRPLLQNFKLEAPSRLGARSSSAVMLLKARTSPCPRSTPTPFHVPRARPRSSFHIHARPPFCFVPVSSLLTPCLCPPLALDFHHCLRLPVTTDPTRTPSPRPIIALGMRHPNHDQNQDQDQVE